MPNVLIPMATRALGGDRVGTLHFARAPYVWQLVERGIEPVLVSSLLTSDMIARAYAASDGLLCMGGGDLDARWYGHENHALNDRAEPERDMLELALIRMAIADRKPFLGICRGMQALAVAMGGSLYQHIPDIPGTEEHGIGEGNGYDALLHRRKHVVRIAPYTRVRSILGADEVHMNSGHHQAVASLGAGLREAGATADGVLEFIEHRDPGYFCVGVQGHPEAQDDPVARRLFDAFSDAVAG
ncbi:MAG: gamma-glutamyl-gamma-aminobutyrate hydrolase family protein [Candidatus Yanofskybacteria bacterium]|nr:gamma-glutamyl-gamma-aminobutyrate hydrolase family protein [Candidatus Yanofskybacteria bacterium]